VLVLLGCLVAEQSDFEFLVQLLLVLVDLLHVDCLDQLFLDLFVLLEYLIDLIHHLILIKYFDFQEVKFGCFVIQLRL